jgi:hypothetical protein
VAPAAEIRSKKTQMIALIALTSEFVG